MELNALLSGWLEKIEKEYAPPAEITALNFGMLQSDKGYMVYITGAEIYDANDDDWAGEIDYQPPRKDKYLLLPRELTKGLKWPKVLELIADALKQITRGNSLGLLFANRVIVAGYDDSALILVKGKV
jgi:hypothetical protein